MDDVLIEIKVSSNEICNVNYLSQVLIYGYIMSKKDIKINKICLFNVQTGVINIIDTSTSQVMKRYCYAALRTIFDNMSKGV